MHLFKLVSGETVIAKIKQETSHKYKVTNPMVLVPQQQSILFMPFMFGAEPNPISNDITIEIEKAHVISVTDSIVEQVYNTYEQRFGSNIIKPSSSTPSNQSIN